MSTVLEWKTNMGQQFRLVGITPIVLAEDVYFVTRLWMENEHDIQNVGRTSFATSNSISGSMLLFAQPEFPDLWDDNNGVPKPVSMEFMADDRGFALDRVLFSKKRELTGYESCDAAYVEWVAEEMSMTEAAQSINSRVTI